MSEHVTNRIDTLRKIYKIEKNKTSQKRGVIFTREYFEMFDTLWSTTLRFVGILWGINSGSTNIETVEGEVKGDEEGGNTIKVVREPNMERENTHLGSKEGMAGVKAQRGTKPKCLSLGFISCILGMGWDERYV